MLLSSGGVMMGQTIIALSQDSVLTETLVIAEDTNIEGNGFSFICKGCSPVIRVSNGAALRLNNVMFPRGYNSFISVDGPDCSASWANDRSTGGINWRRSGDN